MIYADPGAVFESELTDALTGLVAAGDLTWRLIDPATGTVTIAETAVGIVERAVGAYYKAATAPAVSGPKRFWVVWKDTGGTGTVEYVDVLNVGVTVDSLYAKLAETLPAVVAVVSPLVDTGLVTIVRGDDYRASEGRALEWAVSGNWPSLAGATLAFTARRSSIVLEGAATLVGGVVRVEIDGTDTADLEVASNYGFDLQATLANGHVITLIRGTLTLLEGDRP